MTKQKILVPLDGSEFSRQILDTIAQLFAPKDYELILLRVAPPPKGLTPSPPKPVAADLGVSGYETTRDAELAQHPIYASQEQDSLSDELKHELETQASNVKQAGFQISYEAMFGNTTEDIVRCATDKKVDLIAMTTHGRSGLSRLMFGSVAEAVLRHTSVPVLVIRPVDTLAGATVEAVTADTARYIAWPAPVH